MIRVAAVRETSLLTDSQVDAICTALTRQGTYHIARAWDLCAVKVERRTPTAADWVLAFLDNSDQAEALGYHDRLATGLPVMKVFVKDCRADGVAESACASHELAEAMVDPNLARVEVGKSGYGWACEVGDPAQAVTYEVDGIQVQDFVYPAWFDTAPPSGAKFCHTGQIKAPFEVPAGGYAQWTSDLKGWHSIGQELGAGHDRPRRRQEKLGAR